MSPHYNLVETICVIKFVSIQIVEFDLVYLLAKPFMSKPISIGYLLC